MKFDSEECQMMIYCFIFIDTPVTIALLILILVSSEPIASDSMSMICFGVMFLHVGLYASSIHEAIKVNKTLGTLKEVIKLHDQYSDYSESIEKISNESIDENSEARAILSST